MSMKESYFIFKKRSKKNTISSRNYDRSRRCRWPGTSRKYNRLSRIPTLLLWGSSKWHWFAARGIGLQIKLSTYVLTEKDIDTRLTKTWTAIDRLSIIWKSDLTDKMKRSFFQAAVVSILLYGCTTWTVTKRLEKKLGGNYTRMLRAILNKSWRQHPTRHQLYGHLPLITKTIQVRRARHAGHYWRSKDELISDGQAKAGRPARIYIQQLCEDPGCSPEDLPEAMNDRKKWRERGSVISVLAARHDDDDDMF